MKISKRIIIIYLLPPVLMLSIAVFIGIKYYHALYTIHGLPGETIFSSNWRIAKQLFIKFWYLYLLLGFAYLWIEGLGERVLLGTGKVYNPNTNRYFKIYPKIS